jgi:hypothetical protein
VALGIRGMIITGMGHTRILECVSVCSSGTLKIGWFCAGGCSEWKCILFYVGVKMRDLFRVKN